MNGVDVSVIILAIITLISIAGNLAQILEWWETWREKHKRTMPSNAVDADSFIEGQWLTTRKLQRRQERLEQLMQQGIAHALSLGYTPEEIQQACSQHLEQRRRRMHKRGTNLKGVR